MLKKAPPPTDRDACMKEGIACYQDYLRALLDLTDNLARHHGRAAAAGRAARRRRPLPRGGGRQGHRDVLRLRQRDQRRSTATGWATPSPPAAAPATTTRRWASPRAARGKASSASSASCGIDIQSTDFTVAGVGDMSGDVFGNGMLLSPHIRLVAAFDHRHVFIDPTPDAPIVLRRARAPVQAAAFVLGRLRHGADLRRRRRVGAQREVDPDLAAGARGAGHRGRAADADRAAARDPEGAGRPALQRRHRHLREGRRRNARRRRRSRQRRRAHQRRATCAARWWARAATSASRSAAASRRRSQRRRDQHRRDRQLGRRRHLGPRGEHQDPARARRSPTASSPASSATPCWRR